MGSQNGFVGMPGAFFRRLADNGGSTETGFKARQGAERADLLAMDHSLQADLTAKGMVFNTPDPVQFRAALVKAGFYAQWQKTYGTEAWARLEQYTGPLS